MTLRGKYRKTRKRELLSRLKYLTFERETSFGTRLDQIKVEILELKSQLKTLNESFPDRKRV